VCVFPPDMLQHLHGSRFVLSKSAQSLDLGEQEDRWKTFISELRKGDIRIREEVDFLKDFPPVA